MIIVLMDYYRLFYVLMIIVLLCADDYCHFFYNYCTTLLKWTHCSRKYSARTTERTCSLYDHMI